MLFAFQKLDPPGFLFKIWLKCTDTFGRTVFVTYRCVKLQIESCFYNDDKFKHFRPVITAYLSVSAVLAPAFSTDEHVSLGAAHFGELMLSNGLLGQCFPDLFKLCACHLLPNT